jgi:hypothetical protein
MFRVILAVGLVATAGNAAFAQLQLKSNEPVKGRIEEGKANSWTFEVKEDDVKIRFLLSCNTATLDASLVRHGKSDTLVPVNPSNGKGVNREAGRWATTGSDGALEGLTIKPVVAGRYTLTIRGMNKDQTGPYTLTLLEPKFEKKDDPQPQPVPPSRADEVTELKKEMAVLRKEVEALNARVKLLTDLLEKKK